MFTENKINPGLYLPPRCRKFLNHKEHEGNTKFTKDHLYTLCGLCEVPLWSLW